MPIEIRDQSPTLGVRFFQNRLGRLLAVLFLLSTLATLIYSDTFSSSFHFDDEPNIVQNRQIRTPSTFLDVSGGRYVGFLSFALNYRFGRLEVFGYHLVNLLIHITNGVLVFTLVSLLFHTPGIRSGLPARSQLPESGIRRHSSWVALTAALLFLTHPIQTQAVTYIVQRFASLATLFYLFSVVCYLKWRLAPPDGRHRYWWYAGALGSAIVAMKTKEISFTLPFMILLVEGLFFRPSAWRQWAPVIPFLLTLPIIPLAHSGAIGEAEGGFASETTDIGRLSYLLTQARVMLTYLRLLVLPIHQNLDYDYPIYDSWLAPPVFLSLLFLVFFLGVILYRLFYSSSWRLVAFGVLWFFLGLSVESSVIPIRDVIFEHRLYLPGVGLMVAASVIVIGLVHRWGAAAFMVVGIVVATFSVATYQRNLVWKDEISLWSNVVEGSPNKARAHNNLGAAYAKQGRTEEAIRQHLIALRLQPELPKAHNNLGAAYAKQGRLEEAVEEYVTEARLHPRSPDAHYNLGNVYVRQGRPEEAITEYVTALRLDPDLPNVHNNLANVYAQQGRLEEAIDESSIALQLNPDLPDAHNNLGTVYAKQGRLEAAITEYFAALHLQPDLPDARYNLGIAYARQGRLEEAIKEYVIAVQLDPSFLKAHYNLGSAYKLKGLTDEARRHFETVLRLRPDFIPARQALESLNLQPETLQ